MVDQECSAQLGFEDDRATVIFGANPPENAFGPFERGTRRALCGSHALQMAANFGATSASTQGHIEITSPELTQGAGTLSLWVYLDGPASPALEAFLSVDPVSTSSPFLGSLPVGVWTKLQATFADVPVSLNVEKRILFILFSPRGDWSGFVHLDEVKWQPI